MKLAYFIKDVTASGGMERVLSNKCAWWIEQGHEVHVVSLAATPGKQPFFHLPDAVHVHDLGLHSIYRKTLGNKLAKARNADHFVQRAEQWLQQWQPDIAIAMFDDYTRHLCRTPYPCPKVGELHFAKHKSAQYLYDVEKFALGRVLTRWYKHTDYALIKRYDRFVTLTEQDRQAWGALPNNITIGNAQTFPSDAMASLQSKRIIALGRNTSQKRFDRLIHAWSRIAARHPDGKLSIFGPGDKKKLAKLAHKLGIAHQVELGDAVTDIPSVLMESSVLALSSQYEGFGMVLIEAMTCGVPVVSTTCRSGPEDIITEGEDGFLVGLNDIEAMAHALHRLLEEPALRRQMGAAAWHNVQRYSQASIMTQWQQLFESLLPRQH